MATSKAATVTNNESCKWCGCFLPEGCIATCFNNPNGILCERAAPPEPKQELAEGEK